MKRFVSRTVRSLPGGEFSLIALQANLLHDFGHVAIDLVRILVLVEPLQLPASLAELLHDPVPPLLELLGREDRGDGLAVLFDQYRLLLAAHRVQRGVEVRANVVQGLAHGHLLAPAGSTGSRGTRLLVLCRAYHRPQAACAAQTEPARPPHAQRGTAHGDRAG